MGNAFSECKRLIHECTAPGDDEYDPLVGQNNTTARVISNTNTTLNGSMDATGVSMGMSSNGIGGGDNGTDPNSIPYNNETQPVPIAPANKSGFFSKYVLKEEVGVGSTSKCFKCVRKSDNKTFACKVIDKRNIESKFAGLLDQFLIEGKTYVSTLIYPSPLCIYYDCTNVTMP